MRPFRSNNDCLSLRWPDISFSDGFILPFKVSLFFYPYSSSSRFVLLSAQCNPLQLQVKCNDILQPNSYQRESQSCTSLKKRFFAPACRTILNHKRTITTKATMVEAQCHSHGDHTKINRDGKDLERRKKYSCLCEKKRDVHAQLKRELNGNMGEKRLGGVMKLHLFPHLMPGRLGEVGGVLALLQENRDQTWADLHRNQWKKGFVSSRTL